MSGRGVLSAVAVAAALIAGCGDDEQPGKGGHSVGGAAGHAAGRAGAGRGAAAGPGGQAGATGDAGSDGGDGDANTPGGNGGSAGGNTGGTHTGHGGSSSAGLGGGPELGGGTGAEVGDKAGIGGNAGEVFAGDAGAGGAGGEAGAVTPGVGGGGALGGTGGDVSTGGTGGSGGVSGAGAGGSGGVSGAGAGGVAGVGATGGVGETCALKAESCNGVDDDGDGQIDNLGAFTCGLGACQRTVAACAGGAVQHCVPGVPAPGADGCDGIDSDCDGVVDEDCGACWHVAPDGDDDAALASDGATPFATVHAAIAYADTHRDPPAAVCVAAGATCGATATYLGPAGVDLAMRNGIDVRANYESTTWTRCNDSTTHLTPQTGRGIVFGSDVQSPTGLDGFAIDRIQAAIVSGVTIDGAHGAELSNLTIVGYQSQLSAGMPAESYGVRLMNGGDGSVVRSRIDGGYGLDEVSIQSVGSRVDVLDNCSSMDSSGRCISPCGSGPGIRASYFSSTRLHAIDLIDSPGSRVERTSVCGDKLANDGMGIFVTGDARDVLLRANSVLAKLLVRTGYGVRIEDCSAGVPRLVDNASLALEAIKTLYATLPSAAAVSVAGCNAVIEANASIGALIWANDVAGAIECTPGCVITRNADISMQFSVGTLGVPQAIPGGGGTVVSATCSRIDHNTVTGVSVGNCSLCRLGTTALNVQGGWVSSNVLTGGGSNVWGSGVSVKGGRIENNVVVGSTSVPINKLIGPGTSPGASSGVGLSGYGDIDSNFIVGSLGTPAIGSLNCSSMGVHLTQAGGSFRNNIISGGACGASVWRADPTWNPDAFEHNALYNGPPSVSSIVEESSGVIFLDGPIPGALPATWQALATAAQVDALPGFNASGTIDANCAPANDGHLLPGSACIDAGMVTGAPFLDRDGDVRDSSPDVGSDEVPH